MPPPKKVLTLPREVRAQLDRLLVERGMGYNELAEWIRAQGHPISKSALGRYGKKVQEDFERKLAQLRVATETATLLQELAPDEEGAVAEMTVRQYQTRLFELQLEADSMGIKDMSVAARAAADLSRAHVTLRRDRRAAFTEAGKLAEAEAVKRGMSRDNAKGLRAEVEGSA